MKRPHRIAVALATAAIGLISGCQSSEKPTEAAGSAPPSSARQPSSGRYRIPGAFTHHSFYWTAESGIDLTTGAAVPVRAFFESWVIVWNQFRAQQAYPGYVDAVDGHTGFLDKDTCANPFGCADPPKTTSEVVGTSRFHLLVLTSTDRTIHGVLCENEAATIHAIPGGTGYMQMVPGIRVTEFNFARPPQTTHAGDSNAKSQVQQHGPGQAPEGDVFDGFRLVNATSGVPPGDALYDKYASQCHMGLAHPASVNLPGYDYKKDPKPSDPEFQPLPPTPGWPEPRV